MATPAPWAYTRNPVPKLANKPNASPQAWQYSAYQNLDIVLDKKNKRKVKARGWG